MYFEISPSTNNGEIGQRVAVEKAGAVLISTLVKTIFFGEKGEIYLLAMALNATSSPIFGDERLTISWGRLWKSLTRNGVRGVHSRNGNEVSSARPELSNHKVSCCEVNLWMRRREAPSNLSERAMLESQIVVEFLSRPRCWNIHIQ